MTDPNGAQRPPPLGREIPLAPAGGPGFGTGGPALGGTKPFEPEDPMELTGFRVPGGDLEEQLEAIVLEYLMIGWNERQIMLLFTRPVFSGTYQVLQALGERHVSDKVHSMFEEWSRGWLRRGVSNG